MPQLAGHLIIAEKVAQKLNNPQYITQKQSAYNLGSVGPDLTLFMFDFVGRSKALDIAIDLLREIRKITEILSEAKETITGPAEDLIDWFTGDLYSAVTGVAGTGLEALKNVLITSLLPGFEFTFDNPFAGSNVPGVPTNPQITVKGADFSWILSEFGHPFTNDPKGHLPERPGNYSNWWWVDMLHYRRTGPFAHELLQSAGNNKLLKAYAAGYWTHVGGDVCGHPYVNAVVGGPFRNHVIRHMVLENIIDTWIWNHYKNEDIVCAKLDEYFDVGGDISPIADHIIATMRTIFPTPPAGVSGMLPNLFSGSYPNRGDISRAYNTFMLFTDLSTDSCLLAPVPPPGSPGEFFEETIDSITKSAKKIYESLPHGSMSWWQILLAPFLAALYALNFLIKIITLPVAIIIRLATLAPRWLLYYIELAFYNFVCDSRWYLSLGGLGKPSRNDLVRPMAKLALSIPPQRAGRRNAFNYPYGPMKRVDGYWLGDPMVPGYATLEDPKHNEVGPYAAYSNPSIFIDGPNYDNGKDLLLKQFASANTPGRTQDLQGDSFGTQFGNAVDFSYRLITGAYPPTAFDLDGDRGYGGLSWDWDKKPPHQTNSIYETAR